MVRFSRLRRPGPARSSGEHSSGSRARDGMSDFRRELVPMPLAVDRHSVSQLLYERLRPADVEEVARRAQAAPELSALPKLGTDSATDRWLTLNYGVWLRLPAVLERTGLPAEQPPEDVHAMARGPLAAAGGLYEADMIVNALLSAQADIVDADEVLDFGCSSGRVLRALAAAHPGLGWSGCDPNEAAIVWAERHLPNLKLFVSPQAPPLPLSEAALGLAYAISIWSHFAPDLGLRWFDEMHRLIRPGGHLVFTTHGPLSVAHYEQEGQRSPEQCGEIRDALYLRGFWYAAEFGVAGDDGVVNPDWGTAFLSPEWVLTRLCPQWRVLEYAPGRNLSNQDVWVLQRR